MGHKARREERKQLILDALPGNCDQVRAKTGIPRATMRRMVVDLHDQRKVHIIGWKVPEGGGPAVATYAAGEGDDVPLVLRTRAERARDWRKSKPAGDPATEGRRWLGPTARKRLLAEADRTAKTRDPMIEAFFGPARRAV